MKGISLDTVRSGKKYRLVNFGDVYDFRVERFTGENDFILKDIHTLEKYNFQDLIQFGRGKDYCLTEIS